jgi:glycosyltransferase involved in cell wall biosynthesis
MIVAGIVAYNEERLIVEAIRSVKEYADKIVVVDVGFTENAAAEAHSTDRTRGAAEYAANPVPLVYAEETEKLSEVDARNGVLTLCTQKDWLLVIDADEVLIGDHDSVSELMTWVRSGRWTTEALGLAVYTRNIRHEGQAPEIGEEAYQVNPIVSSLGIQPRLFPVRDHRYRSDAGAPGLYHQGEWVGTGSLVTEGFLINNRVGQSFEAYQGDYAWQRR